MRPDGFLPVFSVNSMEEAEDLLVLTCPRNRNGEFVAPELAEEQTLEHLYAFGDRLRDAYEKMKKDDMPKAKTQECDIKNHFDCNGTGEKCKVCGEGRSRDLDSDELECSFCASPADYEKCEDCDGTKRICVEHESPVDAGAKLCRTATLRAANRKLETETKKSSTKKKPPKR